MSQSIWTFPGGKPIDNFATLGAVATISFTVPTGKLWLVYGGTAERDQNADFTVGIYNVTNNMIMYIHYVAAGVTMASWPSLASFPKGPFLLRVGDYIKYTWGAAQTTPEVSCCVLEIDAP